MANFRHRVRNSLIALIIGVAVMLPLFCNMGVRVEALGDPTLDIYLKGGDNLVSEINSEVTRVTEGNLTEFIKYGNNTVTLYISKYNKLDSLYKQDAMRVTLECINHSKLARQPKLKLYNFVAEQDTAVSSMVRQLSDDVNADFATAYSWFKPFSGGVSTVLGFLCIVIFAMLGLMIVIDLAYIVIPPFTAVLNGMVKENEKPKFVSDEAFKAIKEAEASNTYKSALSMYFRHKTVQFIVLGICLLYLIGGKIYSLIAWLIDLFIGLIDAGVFGNHS